MQRITLKSITGLVLALLAALTLASAVHAQIGDPNTRLTLPVRGQTIRGTVVIQGTAKSNNFARYEIAYAQEPDATNWIVFGGAIQAVDNGQLGVWNTRPLADGSYVVRLQVFNTDGSVGETSVHSLTLANGSNAPQPDAVISATQPLSTSSQVPVAEVQSARDTLQVVGDTLGALPGAFVRGGRYALMALAGLGAYTLLKRLVLFALPRVFKRRVDYGR